MGELRRSSRLSTKEDPLKNKQEGESSLPPKKKSKKSDGNNESLGEEDEEEEEAQSEGDSDFKEQEGDGEGEEGEQGEEEEEEEEEEPEEPKELEEGDPIPDVTLKDQDGKEISLKKVSDEHRIVVVFGYPKASTPGCTRQACGFRDNFEELKKHAAIFGLSADTVNAQKKFQDKQNLPFDLLSDPERHLVGLLGAKKSPQSGIVRAHWIFADGTLKHKRVQISPETSIEEGKKEVLDLAKQFEGEDGKKEEDEKKEEGEESEKKEEDN